ncbi:protein transport protein Sec16A isoform X5 [Aquarana catesbeiana]|uniref:protein transport protein Sec16A isoform X5 n=1 Tax=Aquarana catesbeiana TaxID=8400 RepID=UPI003CCA12E3
MQPPPPAGPSGMGGPPRMGMTTNAYWRKRTPTPSAMAAPLVQPVTDPFAFGRMTPQSMAPGNAPKSNMLTMSSPSPSLYPQPGPPSAAADQSLAGAQACIPSSTSQPGAGAAMHSSASPPLLPSGHFSNSMAPAPTMQLGFAHSAPTSLHNITGGLENASVPSQGRSQSRQSVVTEGGNGSHVSAPLQSYPPSSSQQITAPWGSTQVAPPTSSQNFPPTAQHAAYNTPYYSPPYLEVSHLPPQSSDQTYFSAPHRTAPASFPLTGGSNHVQQQSASQFNNTIPVDYMQNQNIEQNSRFGQAYQEPQQNPPLPSSTTLPPGAPLPVPENKPQSESTKIIGSEVNSGTVSTFFKGDEAENVEILSTEQLNASNQASNISYQPIGHSAILSLSQTQPAVSNTQTITSSPFHPPVTYTPSLVSENSSSFQDPHVLWKVDNVDNQHTEAKGGSEQLYDNVENIECVQNLEVLPNEPQNNIFPTGLNSEGLRYGSLPAPALPKNIPSHIEGGPNLEAPGGMSRSVRSDSVSSNYSNLSHRSLPISTRPQELIGTFIQKESGKLENESTNSFFKQIDSSPLGKDSNVQAVGQKTFHGNLSQPPTPSPPKPTGIFQASVNSSFEPVRSYIGVKPIDIDQSKIVGEVRDANKHIPNPSNNATSAVSPGNLEQPPDNLETIFTGSANAEVLNVTSGNVFGVPPFDSLLLDKRPSSRAHGSNKKCESPATTLWAQGELPNFGGNVLLAPPAPAVYVPPKPQNEVIQPPEEGAMATQNSRLDPAQFVTMPEEHTSSENLENPPKIGDDEHPPSQVTKVVQQQPSFETLQPRPGPFHEYMTPVSQAPPGAPPGQVVSGSKPVTYPPQPAPPVPTGQNLADLRYTGTSEPGPKYESSEQKPYPPHPVSTSAAPANPSQSVGYPEQARPPSQTPQQVDPYYYYRGYGAYPSAYPQPYPPMDPRASHLYYQDILLQDSYGTYDPAYRQYSNNGFVNPGKYPYQEPERPSSRSSHCSDRPSSRQGYNAPANYYADYYQTQYDYGDHSRWDRYPETYDPGYRDPRSSYWNFVYAAREDPYRKVPHGYTSRYDVYEDRWQYDPRYVGGFDDEIDARRDLAKDDFDRRSIHSEHSARSVHSEQSVHSRRSSFSSRSQQSQIYKSDQDLTTNVYSNHPANTAHGDYSYSMYPNEYSTQQPLDSSQYVYSSGSEWQPVEQVPSRPLTPEKFGNPHVCARFGPGGHLIKVLPNLPSDGQPTLVEIHNMEIILQSCPEQEQMRAFPGPLVKDETHKVDVINFAQNKAKECTQNENLMDQESARLLWDFIVLLCRQNGTVVGTDIAELLLQDHKTVWLPGKSPNEANLIDFSNEPLEQEEESVASQLSFLTDTLPISGAIMEKETERFREMLLYGRKKDALESAMKHGLWGHALLLASKMDSRTHARVMTRFANSLPINDPLQTVYQLLSGRMPAAATCCGDEKWGDWRPHLAMVLSNITNNLDVPTRTMTTMGDTLASRGLLDAAHFCYIMAQAGFGVYTKKTTKLVLIGSNHSLPFAKFATNEAIQRTEAYEYAQSLGAQTISLPNIQVYKFIYACRLAEHGLSAQAFQYCELIAKTILKHPSYYSPVLVSQLLEVSLHLRFFDPQLKEKPEQELFVEPSWLVRLRHLDMQMKQGTVVYNTGRTTPQQYACSTPSSEQDHISQSDGMPVAHEGLHNTDNPLLANLLPNMIPPVQGVQLALPGPEHTSTYQPPPVSEPSYPVTQQTFVPSPGFSPPVSGPGFGAFSSDPVPTYTPATMEPAPTPPQPTEFTPQEQWNQEPTVQRLPQSSPTKTTFHDPGFDFYGEMAKMAPGQRSRTVSQSSSHMRRTRTTSESSTHSIGSTRRSSIGIQPSPPPPAIPETERSEAKKEPKASYPSQGGSRSWFPLKIGWLMGKGKNEAHLPDDRNKSIVWDENKQRWVNLDEPEGEESKPLPPPPSVMPKRPQSGPGGPGAPPNPSVNMFSIRAGGARGRYVDVLNPGGSKPASTVPPPADLFAPLAPMPIPSNLFVPNSVPEEGQPSLGSDAETVQPPDQPGLGNPTQTQFLSTTSGADLPPSNSEDYPSGELSRSSSLSSLSREVSQHMNQDFSNAAPTSGPPAGTVAFYNPLSFTQQTPAGGSAARPGRLGQRKYPALK